MKHYLVATLGEHRGSPRPWLQACILRMLDSNPI
jgi:hypothetical protein